MDLQRIANWHPPADWRRLLTLEAHTGGEPLRILVAGYPQLAGDDVLACRRDALARFDHLRKALMWEPRGHADMYGCVVLPPATADGHFGVLFLHNEGYSSMCGHGIIAVVTALFETGVLPDALLGQPVRIDAPAGRIVAFAEREGGRVHTVRFRNVPSFVAARDAQVEVPGLGRVRYDLVFGGAYYACVDATDVGLRLAEAEFRQIIELGMRIKRRVMETTAITHPLQAELGFLYGTIFVGAPQDPRNHSRNVCVFADGEVDRSPTGTGVSGRCALHVARGELALHQPIRIESLVGSCFEVQALAHARCGEFAAIVPEVGGSAWLCGRNEAWLAPGDPFAHGFLLR